MTSPLVIAPSWSITYGSVTIGASDENFLGPVEDTLAVFQSRRSARVTFDAIVYSTSSATFLSKNQELLSQFRTPRAQLTIDAPTDLVDYIPTAGASGNIGFDAEPTIVMVPDDRNCDVFQRYRITIDLTLPETLSGQAGRRDNMEMVSFEPNRRRNVRLTGTYTALASNNARAQYDAQIATYATAALAEIESDSSVKWQLINESVSVNDTDKVLDFTRDYREITLAQSTGADDQASVVIQNFEMMEMTPGSRDTYISGEQVKPFQEFVVSFSAVIDVTVTADAGLRALWISTLRPRLLTLAAARLNKGPTSGTTAIEQETYAPGIEANTIEGSFRYVSRNGSGFIRGMMTKTIREDSGLKFTPITTGRPHEYDIDEGPPVREYILAVMEERVKGGSFLDPKPPKNFWERERTNSMREVTRGQGANTITTVVRELSIIYRYAIAYKGSSGASQAQAGMAKAFEPNALTGNNDGFNEKEKTLTGGT